MPIVSLLSADSYDLKQLRNSLENLLRPLGGIESFVKTGDRVLLKPNLLMAGYSGRECITRPEILHAIATMVYEAGGKPFFGDSPAFGSAKGVAKANGYTSILEELDIPVVEFHAKRYDTNSPNFQNLLLSKETMEADVVINLPKIKSHVQLTITLGVKNLFGCVPGKTKAWWHLEAGKDPERFGEMLVETARAIKPDLTIIDGIMAHQGNGPNQGDPRFLGLLGASRDVFALDQIIAQILDVDPNWVPTLVAQEKLGLSYNLADIEFPLAHPRDLYVNDWKLPEALVPIDFSLPRIVGSTFKHLYMLMIKEPIQSYSKK
jgi:uncharacterized protein (DUF362 family)